MTDQRRARGHRNREALIRSAIQLFVEHGYDATTVEQISASAGVSPRTFFHHFPAKEDILFHGYADRLEESLRRFRTSRSTSLWGALGEASIAVAEAMSNQPEVFLVRARLYRAVPSLRATMLRINEDWIDQMTSEVARWLDVDARQDVRPRLAATVINGANRAAIDGWSSEDAEVDLYSLMTECVSLVRPTILGIERVIKLSQVQRAG